MAIEYESDRTDNPDYIYHENQKDHSALTHFHSCFEYMYCSSGKLNVQIDGKNFIMNKGDAVLILPYQIHSNQTVNHSEDYVCVFSSSYIYSFFETHKNVFATNPVFPFQKYADEVNASLQDPGGNRYQKKACLYKILAEFVKHTKFEIKNTGNSALLASLLDYVNDNWMNDISLKKISSILHTNYNYLSYLFNETFKMNFSSFINETRISNAQTMILNPSKNMNFAEIAISCGYSSIRSFNRNFQIITGMTPSKYKSLHDRVK